MKKRTTEVQAPFSVDIAARAEAKFELKGEVPSNSLGRLVDALTDAIRPFTERRGLKADQIRLQRAEVAIEIARLARKKIEQEHTEPKPVSNKILVPLIELSSNEDLKDRLMIDKWADLLASASTKEEVPPIFVQILAQIDGRQARALSKVMLNEYEQWNRPMSIFFDYYEVEPQGVGRWLLRKIEKLRFKNRVEAYSYLVDWFNRPGCYLYDIDEDVSRKVDSHEIASQLGVWYETGLEGQLEICCALGIMKLEEIDLRLKFSNKTNPIHVAYYHLTRLGTEFLECCARDDLGKLENQQKEKDEKIREALDQSAREHFEALGDRPFRTEKDLTAFATRWEGKIPPELQPHLHDRRKVKRCRLFK